MATALLLAGGSQLLGQPNPYSTIEKWGQLPAGRTWGSTSAVDVAPDGQIWVAERCGANTCAGSDWRRCSNSTPSGKLLKSFGAGMIIFPHGFHVDRDGNVWVTDAQGKDGEGPPGLQVQPRRQAADDARQGWRRRRGHDEFNQPSDVVVAPNGDIFVADGHDAETRTRAS